MVGSGSPDNLHLKLRQPVTMRVTSCPPRLVLILIRYVLLYLKPPPPVTVRVTSRPPRLVLILIQYLLLHQKLPQPVTMRDRTSRLPRVVLSSSHHLLRRSRCLHRCARRTRSIIQYLLRRSQCLHRCPTRTRSSPHMTANANIPVIKVVLLASLCYVRI